jgi:hypothetical protein
MEYVCLPLPRALSPRLHWTDHLMPLAASSLWLLVALAGMLSTGALAAWVLVRRRNMHYWLPAYVFPPVPRPTRPLDDRPLDVFIAVCDHFEPECYGARRETACARVRRWVSEYPRLFQGFADVDGRPPQHTFFFPQDEYRPEYLDELAQLRAQGFGDVDVHLHHDGDTAAGLRDKLEAFRDTLHRRHGLLRTDPVTGRIVFGFIHGNWALCNSLPNGRWCGVDEELTVLLEAGCYADFTLPSAPSPAQTRTINSIYYARDLPGRRKSHDSGVRARAGCTPPADHLLLIQGPLLLDWESRKLGLVPRIENGDLHADRPATRRRWQLWLRAGVHVAGRPDQVFVKLHTHGCKDGNIDTLLGAQMQEFHADLARCASANPNVRYHYVTAWEMAQRVHRLEREATSPALVAEAASFGAAAAPECWQLAPRTSDALHSR